jgi:fermentation-respiration switch protein FrsA (DUF1100 family)
MGTNRRRLLALCAAASTGGVLAAAGGEGTATAALAPYRPRRVRFTVDGISIIGHLRVPASAGRPRPAVLVAGPSPQVKEQAPDVYATRLTAAGYVTLTIDYRNFGESGGTPRYREDVQGKVADLRAAVSFLTGRSEVDARRIAIVGVCAGGGYALKAAAFDSRVAAFVGVAGFYPRPALMRSMMGADAYQAALAQAIAVLEREDRGGPVEYMPHVTPPGGGGVMEGGEAWEYYGTPRGQVPNYRNELTRDTVYTGLVWDNASCAEMLTKPALVVHGEVDLYTPPEQATAVYEKFGGVKEIVWLPTDTHIGYYDDDSYLTPTLAAVTRFLGLHLRA